MNQMKTEFDRRVYTRQTALSQIQDQSKPRLKPKPESEEARQTLVNSEPNSTLYVFSPNNSNSNSNSNSKNTNGANNPDVSNAPKTSNITDTYKTSKTSNTSNTSNTLNTLNNPEKLYVRNVQKRQSQVKQQLLPAAAQTKQLHLPQARKESGSAAVIQAPVKPRVQAVVQNQQGNIKSPGAGVNQKNETKIILTVTHLADRFKKNGLGIIDSYFNACFFYCQYHKTKNEKGKKGHEIQNTGKYGAYLAFLTLIARLWGFILDILSPVRGLFKLIEKAAKKPKNISVKSAAKGFFGLAVPAAAIFFTVMTINNIYAYKPQLEFSFNGQTVGFVDSKETVSKVVSLIENNVGSVLNEDYVFTGDLSYRIVLAKDSVYVSDSDLYYLMYSPEAQDEVTAAYGLYIDDKFLGASSSESEINEILDEVLEANSGDAGTEIVQYANDIKIIPDNYPKRDVVTLEELKNILTYSAENSADTNTGINENISIKDTDIPLAGGRYIEADTNTENRENGGQILQGEIMRGAEEDIAVAAAMSAALAPETINTLPRGFLDSPSESTENSENQDSQESQYSQNELLSHLIRNAGKTGGSSIQFKKIKTESYYTEIPFETKFIESDKYYTGTQTVQNKGSNGESLITSEVTYIGNEEVERETTNIEITKQPVAKVIIIGTKIKPKTTPTGIFMRPIVGGRTTTRFGQRGHRGLDVAAPYGTLIYAADGGTVTFAGWHSSYGNYVKINHGNGYETIYAHASSLLVKVGDKVYKGQEIAKVGSTGNSTGNHLHFEVFKNGALVNPESYINK